jgi:chitin disaccharide deacetylase
MKASIHQRFTMNTSNTIACLVIVLLTGMHSTRLFADPDTADRTSTWAEKLGYPRGKKVLLLHIDDAGMCPEANVAAKKYIEDGVVISAAVMMPCPNAAEFVEWANHHPKADVGVHLTLTSEWKTYRWSSITDPKRIPGLIDPDGKFWHEVKQVVAHASPGEVEQEIRAQIDRMKSLGHTPSHIDTHMGTLFGSAAFLKVFIKLAEEYQIPANIIDFRDPEVVAHYRQAGYPIDDDVIGMVGRYKLPKLDNFLLLPGSDRYEGKRLAFIQTVQALKPGLTEIAFHPSVETDNFKTILNRWPARVWESKLFYDPVVVKMLKEQGVIITTWTEVMERFKGVK